MATAREGLLRCAGTKYTRAPVLLGLREAIDRYGKEELDVAGTPCQIWATRLAQTAPRANLRLTRAIKLHIGIFCSGVFDYGFFSSGGGATARDAPWDSSEVRHQGPHVFDYRWGKHRRELMLDALERFVLPVCKRCPDFTAELAVISIGCSGLPRGRSTVLVRTGLGMEAFDRAKLRGSMEVSEFESVEPGPQALFYDSRKKKGNRQRARTHAGRFVRGTSLKRREN